VPEKRSRARNDQGYVAEESTVKCGRHDATADERYDVEARRETCIAVSCVTPVTLLSIMCGIERCVRSHMVSCSSEARTEGGLMALYFGDKVVP